MLSFFAVGAVRSALSAPPSLTPPSLSQGSDWQDMGELSVRLIRDRDSLGQGVVVFGLEQVLREGWKTYWRSPGAAGFPLSVDWSASENVKSLDILWPAPHRFTLFGLETFGYAERVLFPLVVTVKDSRQPLTLRLRVNYLICETVCIPYSNSFETTLQPGGRVASGDAALIDAALATVPQKQDSAQGLFRDLFLHRQALVGVIEFPSGDLPAGSDILVEGPLSFTYAPPVFEQEAPGRYRFVIQTSAVEDGRVLEGKQITLTYRNAQHPGGVEWREIVRLRTEESIWVDLDVRIFFVALLGGLILNVMPCVLPVLSLKVLSLVDKAGVARTRARGSMLVSASGILVSFWILALGTVVLKLLGLSVGWGIQFQQPVFLGFMAFVVVFFATNLFGLFDVAVPRMASGLVSGQGYKSDFATGVFATLLATPCSAPFLGTSVAAALAGGYVEIFSIFTALGVGMALPYLLVALFPASVGLLPKSGPWMGRVKQVMGLALGGTALWLLFIVRAQSGFWVAGLMALTLVALVLVLWLFRHRTRTKWAGVVLAFVFILSLPVFMPSAPFERRVDSGWIAFEEQAIAPLVRSGRTVFVDVTADWCVTCQVNKKLVLEDDAVQRAFSQQAVVLMRADWTAPDPVITAFLESSGRYGIPFNIVYGPARPEGVVLSEILSRDEVQDALRIVGQ